MKTKKNKAARGGKIPAQMVPAHIVVGHRVRLHFPGHRWHGVPVIVNSVDVDRAQAEVFRGAAGKSERVVWSQLLPMPGAAAKGCKLKMGDRVKITSGVSEYVGRLGTFKGAIVGGKRGPGRAWVELDGMGGGYVGFARVDLERVKADKLGAAEHRHSPVAIAPVSPVHLAARAWLCESAGYSTGHVEGLSDAEVEQRIGAHHQGGWSAFTSNYAQGQVDALKAAAPAPEFPAVGDLVRVNSLPSDRLNGLVGEVREVVGFRCLVEFKTGWTHWVQRRLLVRAERPAAESVEYVWAGPYRPYVTSSGEAGLEMATYSPLPCGCCVIGNGTLPHPLTVKLCALHEQGLELLGALRDLYASAAQAPSQVVGSLPGLMPAFRRSAAVLGLVSGEIPPAPVALGADPAAFGVWVLDLLQETEEWSAETVSEIAHRASTLGLARGVQSGDFARVGGRLG